MIANIYLVAVSEYEALEGKWDGLSAYSVGSNDSYRTIIRLERDSEAAKTQVSAITFYSGFH